MCASASAAEVSSEMEGMMQDEIRPKGRPWRSPGEAEKRRRSEANVGPEIWIF